MRYEKTFGKWEFYAFVSVGGFRQWEIIPRLRIQSITNPGRDRNLAVGIGWLNDIWLHVSVSRVAS